MQSLRIALRALGATALVALATTTFPSFAHGATGAGIDPANLDPTCKACDDFARFATGGWTKSHPIPPGHPVWGAFNELVDHNREALRTILEADAKNTAAPAGSDEQKIGAFYRSCMDEHAIEAAGTTPIAPLLAQIDAIHDVPSLTATIGVLEQSGVDAGIDYSSEADTKDSSRTIASIGLGGLGMPDRDYYLKDDTHTVQIRGAYHDYVVSLLGALGEPHAATSADSDAIIALETTFARATPTLVELRDPQKWYHPMTIAELHAIAPHAPWNTLVAGYGGASVSSIDVNVPAFVTAYDAQLATTPLPVWKAFLRFHLADVYAPALPKAFADANFAFRGTTLTGVKEQLPRWQRCTAQADRSLRDVLGKAYVATNFPPAAKSRALAMVNNVQAVLRDDIGQLDWMSAPTKTKAIEKLNAFTKKIGYPDRWEDFSGLQIADAPYAANLLAARRFAVARDIAQIGKPTDRSRWGMTPPTVNAYYSASNNEIVFPAGILSPPFFDPSADDAVNYGAIGAVIGHEMTHGFDDQGRQFDARGNLHDWWTAADATAFGKRAQCIVEQYDAAEVLPGVHMNGKQVLGEAIADLGGLTIAYKAFERTPEARSHTMTDGYTPEQRFFLAFAQVWRGSQSEAYTRQLAAVDVHANNKLRVNATLANMPEFRKAFACAATAPMVRANACQIW